MNSDLPSADRKEWSPLKRSPIHEAVAEDLRRVLAGRELNTKIEPEPELASRYSISVPTLRNATLILEREGILKRRQGSGTFIVGRGTSTPSPESGLAFDVCLVLNNELLNYPHTCSFHFRQIHAIYSRLVESGISAKILFTDHEREGGYDELRDLISRRRIKCIAFLQKHPESLLDLARANGVALANFRSGGEEHSAFSPAGSVRPILIDYHDFLSLSLTEVLQQGGKRVALISWWESGGELDRSMFFSKAKELGLQTQSSWVIGDLSPKESSSGWAAFREFWTSSEEHPDSLIISDEALLPGALQAMSELGIAPGNNFRIVCHGNAPDIQPLLSRNTTRIWYDLEDFVSARTRTITDLLAGRPYTNPVTIRPTIERVTTKAAPVNA
jgi:DNA-binding LacI/PurR family transcriptional regulator